MKLILVDNDDVVLDEVSLTREEFDAAKQDVIMAHLLIESLQAGAEAQ